MFAHKRAASSTWRSPTGAAVHSLLLVVADLDDSHPQLETDESYTLVIVPAGATLSAPTVYGALRGLETFSQLLRFNFSTSSYYVPGAPWRIADAPRFPHRGLMVDTSRHFQTLASLRGIIDSLPYAKINVYAIQLPPGGSNPNTARCRLQRCGLPAESLVRSPIAGCIGTYPTASRFRFNPSRHQSCGRAPTRRRSATRSLMSPTLSSTRACEASA
eukprot:4379790-Prymnesium_polylepis.3